MRQNRQIRYSKTRGFKAGSEDGVGPHEYPPKQEHCDPGCQQDDQRRPHQVERFRLRFQVQMYCGLIGRCTCAHLFLRRLSRSCFSPFAEIMEAVRETRGGKPCIGPEHGEVACNPYSGAPAIYGPKNLHDFLPTLRRIHRSPTKWTCGLQLGSFAVPAHNPRWLCATRMHIRHFLRIQQIEISIGYLFPMGP